MSSVDGRILFRLTERELVVENTGQPFTLHGLVAIIYGWTSSKKATRSFWPEDDRDFTSEDDARHVVSDLCERQRKHFSDPYHQLREASQQSQTAQGYADRALLELLQNAVDANRTDPIGSKGIGFRSILNLTDAPEIHSGKLHVHWSPKISSQAMGGIRVESSTVLAFPEWCPAPSDVSAEFVTSIKLPLSASNRTKFEAEWGSITGDPSLIVFIDGIRQVRWESDESPKLWQRNPADDVISIIETIGEAAAETRRWRLHHAVSRKAVVAVQEGDDGAFIPSAGMCAGKLRCFFPTDDPNPFPKVLIHATFLLAQDRKRIDLKHDGAKARITDVAEAMVSAVANRTVGEALDILEHAEIAAVQADRIEARLCEAVRAAVGTHRFLALRSCPVREQLPSSWQNESRIEKWEKFKTSLAEHRPGALGGLPLLPAGTENKAREKTLLWLNPQAPLTPDSLRLLAWATIDGGTMPVDSASVPLFEVPDDEAPLPSVPPGIHLHFLDRAFQKTLQQRLGVSVARDLLRQTLGVRQFKLLDVVEHAILPAIKVGEPPAGLISLLQNLWRHAGDEGMKPFDWTDVRRASLIAACKVECRTGELRPALEVYAGSDWTNSDFLERVYGTRKDRALLHAPPANDVDRAEWERFYRWLGVGWSPKVLPIVLREANAGTREGWQWSQGKFNPVNLADVPGDWSSYCLEVWSSGHPEPYRARLRQDWQIDGGSGALLAEGAFALIRKEWQSYASYLRSVSFRTSNMNFDRDDSRRENASYLSWQFKHRAWIPAEPSNLLRAPCDLFIAGEVAQSRNIRGWAHELKAEVPADMASALGLRRNWSEVGEADWRRWLAAAEKRKPQGNIEDREPIRRLYACLLDNAKPPSGGPAPFSNAAVWWVERLENPTRENWKLATAAVLRASYLDRPEFESLRLPGVFILPTRLDEKEGRANALLGISRLSARLTGVPAFSGEREIVELRGLIRQRAPYVVAYLGLERNEQGRAKIRDAIDNVLVFEVEFLTLRWLLDGTPIAGEMTTPSSYATDREGSWRLYLVAEKRQIGVKWAMKPLAKTILLACGFRPTEKADSLCEILSCDTQHLDGNLTNLGVAPETVEAAKHEAAELPDSTVKSGESASDVRGAALRGTDTVSETGHSLMQSHAVGTTHGQQNGSATGLPLSSQTNDEPSHTHDLESAAQRDHTQAFDAQEWLRDELVSCLRDTGWTVSDETKIDRSRVDIVLNGPHTRYLIEVKQVNKGVVYWREEQIKTAQVQRESSNTRYIVALVTSSGEDNHEVRWVWDPLLEFAVLRPEVSWYWKELPVSGGLNSDWCPNADPPCVGPARYKAVITLTKEFLTGLSVGIGQLLLRLGIEVPER
jgi:hypothetical protein